MVKRQRPRASQPKAAGYGATPVSMPVLGRLTPSADAVSLFDRAMQSLQRHAFADGAQHFRVLLDSFPRETALCERSQVYLDLCERQVARRPHTPQTLEERLTAATAALNNDDDRAAEDLARGVLEDVPRHELALYLVAALAARRGAVDEALELLAEAIAVSPEVRAQARHDRDFEDLRDLEAFRQLLKLPSAQGWPATRRGRLDR